MRIAACLCWYDEPIEFLQRCVASLPPLVDSVVAIDGRWQHMPGPDLSPLDQEEALWEAIHEQGMTGRVRTPSAQALPFADQAAKRTELLRMGSEIADWLLVIDSDEWIEHCDAGAVRALLAETDLDAVTVTLRNRNPDLEKITRYPRRLLRAGELVYDGAHNAIRRADGGWLVLPMRATSVLEPAEEHHAEHLVIHHAHRMRPRERTRRQVSYYETRAKLKLERRDL